jgi:hypothetical protein
MSSVPASRNADELLRFEWSVRALAQDAEVQKVLFPAFVCAADELALEFDECLRGLVGSGRLSELSVEQSKLVEDLDQKLTEMSGTENEPLWTDEALSAAPEWTVVREAATRLVNAMGWSSAPPPTERYVYVGPDA